MELLRAQSELIEAETCAAHAIRRHGEQAETIAILADECRDQALSGERYSRIAFATEQSVNILRAEVNQLSVAGET